MNPDRIHRFTRCLLPALSLSFIGCKVEAPKPPHRENEGAIAAYGIVDAPDAPPAGDGAAKETGWTELLDADLSQWTTFLSPTKRGDDLAVSDVFSARSEEGETVLTVSGKCPGALTSVEDFGDYHLTLEYRWDSDGAMGKKASGLLYHCTGGQGEVLDAWMRGIEFDISESGVGGLYALADNFSDVPGEKVDGASARYIPGLAPRKIGRGAIYRCFPIDGLEVDHSGWVRVDLYVLGSSAQHYVDGVLALELQNAGLHRDGQDPVALTEGKIQIQSEGAGISFRKIRVREIDALPERT